MSFENKVVVITGAASGIGKETARQLKEEGAKIIALDRNCPEGNYDVFIEVDLQCPIAIEEAISKVPSGVDVLCNVAGVPPTAGVNLVLKVNVLGLIKLTEGIVSKLNNNASIVNVASLAGHDWTESVGSIKDFIKNANFDNISDYIVQNNITDERSYFFAKEILICWTMLNRWTWRSRGIRINSVSPGPILTPILDDFLETLGERAEEDMALMQRAGTPMEIANVIKFLASDKSGWIFGANIPCDGGMYSHVMSHKYSLE